MVRREWAVRHRTGAFVAASTLALMVGGAGLVFACTSNFYIQVSPASGPMGSVTRVSGTGFVNGPVEIRWNGSTGPILGTAQGPSFTGFSVTIPKASPDTYLIYATQPETVGLFESPGVATYEVLPGGDQTSGLPPSGGGSPSSAANGGGGFRSISGGGANSAASIPDDATSSTLRGPAASGPAAALGNGRGARASRVTHTAVGASGPGGPGASGAGFGDGSSGVAASAGGNEPGGGASRHTVSTDLWRGFGPGFKPSERVVSMDGSLSSTGINGLQLGAGIGFIGVMALMTGFVVAEASRRRVLAPSTRG